MSGQVVVVPGNLGSSLYDDNHHIWIDPLALAVHGFLKLQLRPDGSDLVGVSINARGLVPEFYGLLSLGLRIHGFQVREFPYDWRQKIDFCASNLAGVIGSSSGTVSVVSHSLGCSVTRRAIQILYDVHGRDWTVSKIRNSVFLCPAFHGCFVACLGVCASTKGIPLIGSFPQPGPKAKETARTFRSLYELFPWESTVFDSLLHNDVSKASWWGSNVETPLMSLVGSQSTHGIRWFHDHCTTIIGDSKDEVMGGVEWSKDGKIQPDGSVIAGDGFVPRISSLLPGVKTYMAHNTGHLQLPSSHAVIHAVADIINGRPVTSLPAW